MAEQNILFAHTVQMKLNAAKAQRATAVPRETMSVYLAEELPQLTPEEIEAISQES